MTLIATFNVEEFPIVFGDLLLSRPVDIDPMIVVPTLGEITVGNYELDGHVPSGLCQKLIKLSPELLVCWSGKKSVAKQLLLKIIESGLHQNINSETFFEDLRTIRDSAYSDLQLIFLVCPKDSDCGFMILCHNTECIETFNSYGLSSIRGGGNGFRFLWQYCDNNDDEIPQELYPDFSGLQVSILKTLSLCSHLVSDEITTEGHCSLEGWFFGGGYEIAYPEFIPVKDRFEISKIPDITYFYHVLRLDSDYKLMDMMKYKIFALKSDYVDDILVIRRVEMGFTGDQHSITILDDSSSFIPNLIQTLDEETMNNFRKSSINSDYFILALVIVFPDRKENLMVAISIYDDSSSGNGFVTFQEDEQKNVNHVKFSSNYFNYVQNIVNEKLAAVDNKT